MSDDAVKLVCITLVVLGAIYAGCTGHSEVASAVVCGLLVCAFLGVP